MYDCLVSWYKKTDTYYFDRTDNPCDQFEHVVAGFDLSRMMQDPEYLRYAIKGIPEEDIDGLFQEKRVKRYLETGLKTEEEIEEEKNRTGNDRLWLCGRYVGEIADRKDGRLGKSFNIYVGIAEHRSPAMEQARITHRQKLEREKQYQLASRRAEIEAERASIAERQSRLAEMEAELAEEDR